MTYVCTVVNCEAPVEEDGELCVWHTDDEPIDLIDPDYDGPWDSRQAPREGR